MAILKRIIWLDDHLDTQYEEENLGEFLAVLAKNRIELIKAQSVSQLATALKKYEHTPRQISGLLIDLLITHDLGHKDWSDLGCGTVRFSPYTAGAQFFEILLNDEFEDRRPSFVNQFRTHQLCLLTVARSAESVLGDIEREQRNRITAIYKTHESAFDKFASWLNGLPEVLP